MTVSTAATSKTNSARSEVAALASKDSGRRIAQVVAPLIVFALVIGIWLFISYVLLEPRRRFLMPPPQDVLRVGLFDARNASEILGGLWSTAQVAFVGLFVAIAIGTLVAVAMIQARWVE